MALSLPADIPQRALLQEITFGVVLFTLLVQGDDDRLGRRTGIARRTAPPDARRGPRARPSDGLAPAVEPAPVGRLGLGRSRRPVAAGSRRSPSR